MYEFTSLANKAISKLNFCIWNEKKKEKNSQKLLKKFQENETIQYTLFPLLFSFFESYIDERCAMYTNIDVIASRILSDN